MNYPKSIVEKPFYLFFSAILQAVLLNLAWPPHQSTVLVFAGLVPLFFLHRSHGVNPAGIFLLSWLSFFLFHLLAAWWMYSSTVAGSLMAHMVNSFCMAAVLLGWSVMDRSLKAGPVLSFFILASFWISFEWLHHRWDIAWPWFTLGNVFSDRTSWIQWYSYTGVLGGSLWILGVNFLISEFIVKAIRYKPVVGFPWGVAAIIIAVIPVIISSLMVLPPQMKQSYNILIVQPDIDPVTEKFDQMSEEQQLGKAIGLLETVDLQHVDLVVLPETLLTQAINEDSLNQSFSLQRLKSAILSRSDAALVVGAYTRKPASEVPEEASVSPENGNAYVLYNSALYLSNDTVLVYHKSQLLPLVEKQPFSWVMAPFRNLIERSGGFFGSYGTRAEALEFGLGDTVNLFPVICFESVFGHRVRNRNNDKPAILVTLTNDGWWGSSGGYLQHLNYARLRSIENRMWNIRAANTGVSAIIDPHGNIVKQTNYGTEELLSAEVPAIKPGTFYAKYGDLMGIGAGISTFLLGIIHLINRLVKGSKGQSIKNDSK
jgi:apolipoprotein N-acyltransferase